MGKATRDWIFEFKKMPLKLHENILVFYKEPPTYNPQMRKGFKPYRQKSGKGSSNYGDQISVVTDSNGERFPVDILSYPRDKIRLHPTQKPVSLLEYFILTYTNAEEIVLDNCMGCGSTGVACCNLNRKFIGIELNEEYYKIACKRILDAKKEEKNE